MNYSLTTFALECPVRFLSEKRNEPYRWYGAVSIARENIASGRASFIFMLAGSASAYNAAECSISVLGAKSSQAKQALLVLLGCGAEVVRGRLIACTSTSPVSAVPAWVRWR